MNIDPKKDFATTQAYLNNAAISIVPSGAVRTMNDFMTKINEIGPNSLDGDSFRDDILQKTRKAISQIIKCHPDEIILTQSTTDGINIVSHGLEFPNNSNILIRGKEHEHHSNYYPWIDLQDRVKVNNLSIDENGFFTLSQLDEMTDSDTKLVALSHALYNTGAILPVNEVGEILYKKDIPYFLDAAQTIGCIGEFDVKKTNCNFMAFNGSKWLCGPLGTGFFYCKRDSAHLLEPTSVAGESAILCDDKITCCDIPDKFQSGFRNYVGMAGLEYCANYFLQYGLDNIRRNIIGLANQLRDELQKIPGITLIGPEPEDQRTSIVSFTMQQKEPQYIVEKLEGQGIILAVREIMDKKIVRASPHFFNTAEQIQAAINAIKIL